MNTKKLILTYEYVKWVVNTYFLCERIVIISNGTISFKYIYKTKRYMVTSFDECKEFKNRLTAINYYKELEYNLNK